MNKHLITSDQVARATREALAALAQGDDPILVGPWLGEVGYELLYWIPFVRWAVNTYHLDPRRLWVVSRGGCQGWYAELGAQYIELLDLFTPAEFVAHNGERIAAQGQHGPEMGMRRGMRSAKQHEISDFDHDILAQVTRKIGTAPRLLHPSILYALLRPYWRRRGPNLYAHHTQVRAFDAPPKLDGLPASYVAVKFYTSDALRDQFRYKRQIAWLLEALLRVDDVVICDDATIYDEEHDVFSLADHPRLHRVTAEPATNLATQTAVIAHARAFFGTYGGFAYLAPLLGVPTMAFYGKHNFRDDHLALAHDIFRRFHVRFDVMDLPSGVERLRREWKRRAA